MSDSDESRVTRTEISSRLIGPAITRLASSWPPRSHSHHPTDVVPELYIHEYMPIERRGCFPGRRSSHCILLCYPLLSHPELYSEDPVDYPADRGDDGDDEDESSEDDKDDDEVDIEADDDKEEEEYPAPVDSAVVALPAVDQALSAKETEPFETDESAATPPPHPTSRYIYSTIVHPLLPWSHYFPRYLLLPLPPIPSPSLLVSPPLPVSSPVPVLSLSPPASPIRLLGYQAAMIRLRSEVASTSHSLPLPPPIILSHTRPAAPLSGTPPLHLLFTDRREDIPEVTLPPRKRLGIALSFAYEVRESSSAAAARAAGGLRADYGFVATMDKEIRRDPQRDDMDEIYTKLDDEQFGRQLLAADRRRQTVITEMLAADHRRQKQLTEALKLIKRHQNQMTEFERQQGLAKDPAQPELPEEASSSS
ncbi:hypothetical protein Tco_0008320 [Tanacetum coccineum]